MAGLFDAAEIGVPCPGCSGTTPKTIAWIKAHTEFTCDHCGAIVSLDKVGLEKGLGQADADLERLKKSIRQK
jgi:ribosomal protein S27E